MSGLIGHAISSGKKSICVSLDLRNCLYVRPVVPNYSWQDERTAIDPYCCGLARPHCLESGGPSGAVLLVQFLFSVLLGPMMDSCCVKFGSILAFIVNLLVLAGMVGFFKFLVCI